MKPPHIVSVTLCGLLAACNPAANDLAEGGGDPVAGQQAEAKATSTVVSDALDDSGDQGVEESAGAGSSPFTSRYTDSTPDNCKTVEKRLDEAGYIKQRCPGVGGVPLIVTESDGRMSVHAGNAPTRSTTLSAFNILGRTVEWRLAEGEPFAIIYRLIVATPESPDNDRSQLFVSKFGKGETAGCLIAEIAGEYPKANEKARRIADANRDFACGESKPMTFGDVMR